MSQFTGSLVFVAGLFAVAAAAAPSTAPAKERTLAMQEFALIFRPTRTVDPAQLPRRNAAAREWALSLRRNGTLHTASPLEDNGFVVTEQGVAPVSSERAVASVLIVQARDLDAAVALAKGHPGLSFGTEIEVRPVKATAPAPR